MTNKIFKSILFVAFIVISAVLVIITGFMYQHFGNIQQAQLKDELNIAAKATQLLGTDYLEELDSKRYRITWINPDGTVIFDSHANTAVMENHADREEIKEAFTSGTGSSTRKSSTLTEQTIYEAMRLEDGTVLRISVSHATALALVFDMLTPIVIVLIIAIVISAWLAHSMAKRVVDPLNKLNLEKPLENDAYEELSPLLNRINAQHLEIKSQILTLKRKQDEFDQITCNMKEALILLDHTGRIISINPAALKLFSIGIEYIGEDFLAVDRKQDMRFALEEAKAQGHSDFRDNINGQVYQFDISRIDSDGNTQGMVILAFDITDHVNAEKHRQEFTANVSHELKTPLQSIIGSAELMENGIVKQEDAPRFVERIRKEAIRLVSLIDDIIRLSELDEGSEMQRENVSLRMIAEEVRETLADAAKTKDITMKVIGDDGVVNGVRRLLYEIVYNLCDNAIKYNKPDGKVKISIEQQVKTVCLRVSDTGIGIAPEDHDKIFERFYRVDKSHSKQSGGTGLGLSIVKHAVQYHHGKIDVKSTLGIGTTISVLFQSSKQL